MAISDTRRVFLTSDYDAQKKHLKTFFNHMVTGMSSLKTLSSPLNEQPNHNIYEMCEFVYSDEKSRQNAINEYLGEGISTLTDAFISTHENISALKRTIAEHEKLIAVHEKTIAERDKLMAARAKAAVDGEKVIAQRDAEIKDLKEKVDKHTQSADDSMSNEKENVGQNSPRVIRKCRRAKNANQQL